MKFTIEEVKECLKRDCKTKSQFRVADLETSEWARYSKSGRYLFLIIDENKMTVTDLVDSKTVAEIYNTNMMVTLIKTWDIIPKQAA